MRNIEEFSPQPVSLSLPVKIKYPVINELLKEKLIGEIISKDKSEAEGTNYAQILNAIIYSSTREDYDLCLELDLQTLTSLFKNRRLKIFFHAALELDIENQQVFLSDYKVEGQTRNWLADKFIQSLANTWMYDKLKKKMNFDLMPPIQEQLDSINQKLKDRMEVKEGVFIEGGIRELEVRSIQMNEEALFVILGMEGDGLIDLEKIQP